MTRESKEKPMFGNYKFKTVKDFNLKMEEIDKACQLYHKANREDKENNFQDLTIGGKIPTLSKKIYKQKNEFKCKHCKKVLKTAKGYQHHIYRHENPFLCYKCNVGFTDKKDLQTHFKSVHKETYKTPSEPD